MNRFDVVHVTPYYRPATRFGGPVASVSGLAEEQARRGMRVAVVTTDAAARPGLGRPPERVPTSGRTEELDGVEVTWCPLSSPGLWYAASDLPRELERCLGERTVVHAHGVYNFPTAWASFQAARSGAPLVIAPRGTLDAGLIGRRGRLRKLPYLRAVEVGPYRDRAVFHATSEKEVADVAALLPAAAVALVPNGLDPVAFEPGEADPGRDPFRVVFLGRLSWEKGVGPLLAAFAEARITGAELVLAGVSDPEQERKFRSMAEGLGLGNSVAFPGLVEGAAKWRLLDSASLVALLSESENFGLSAAEGMARGVPALVTTGVGIHGAVRDAAAGWVVGGSDGAAAEALRQIARSPAVRRARGSAARELARARWAWRDQAVLMEEVYGRARGLAGGATAVAPAGAFP